MDGIAHGMRSVLPVLAERCEIKVGELVASDGSQAYIDHLREACAGADLIHVEHNHGYFSRGRIKNIFSSVFRDTKVPIVLSINEVPEPTRLGWPSRSAIRRFIVARQMRNTLRHVQAVYTYSDYQARSLGSLGAPAASIINYPHYVPIPIDSDDKDGSNWRQQNGISSDARLMLVFGFISRRKRLELAIQALAKMPKNTMLVIGGSPVFESDRLYFESTMEMAESLGLKDRIIVTGYLPDSDLSSVMNAADLVLFPPSDAYSSGSLARAISFRRPILAASTHTVREIITAEPCMSTFEPNNASDLARVADGLLDSHESRIKLSDAANRYGDKYTIDARAHHYVETYRKLAGERAVSGHGMTVVSYGGTIKVLT
jgi:glycosyltransferase involved in cell wall biosynthesis